MARAKILVAEFKHETNSFCRDKTGLKQYRERYFKEGQEIISFFKGVKSEMGGFIDVGEEENFELVPSVAANAWPGGPVTREVFENVKGAVLTTLRNQPVDAILLSLHGAMVLEDSPDGEGELLAAIREHVGEEVPIMATLDLHANITKKMVKNVDGLFPFDQYPHIDMYDRGYEAAQKMAEMLRGQIRPTLGFKQLPLLITAMETGKNPYKKFLDMAHEWEKDPRVITVSIVSGFPYADTFETGMSVLAQTNDDRDLAETIVQQIGSAILEKHREFVKSVTPVGEAIKRAMEAPEGPIVLADTADNPGGGSVGDGTVILREMIRMKAANAAFALIPDPEVVEQAIEAGVGSFVAVALGAKVNPLLGEPVKVKAYVKTITDGKFINKGPMSHGLQNQIGRSVVLDIDGIEVIVSEFRFQPWDPEIFRRFGIEPTEKQILVVKSSLHYRAAFSQFAKEMIDVDAPGLVARNLKKFQFRHVRRPIFPLDVLPD